MLRHSALFVLLLVVGCSEPTTSMTLQEKWAKTLREKWAKVQSLNVKDSTVAELTSKLGTPYRSNDGETKRSRFWYPFEGVTSDNKPETAPMLIVIVDDDEEITSYMLSEPVIKADAPTRILPREYKLKIDGKWKRRDLKTGKVVDE